MMSRIEDLSGGFSMGGIVLDDLLLVSLVCG